MKTITKEVQLKELKQGDEFTIANLKGFAAFNVDPNSECNCRLCDLPTWLPSHTIVKIKKQVLTFEELKIGEFFKFTAKGADSIYLKISLEEAVVSVVAPNDYFPIITLFPCPNSKFVKRVTAKFEEN